jgi:hypothetical protein
MINVKLSVSHFRSSNVLIYSQQTIEIWNLSYAQMTMQCQYMYCINVMYLRYSTSGCVSQQHMFSGATSSSIQASIVYIHDF